KATTLIENRHAAEKVSFRLWKGVCLQQSVAARRLRRGWFQPDWVLLRFRHAKKGQDSICTLGGGGQLRLLSARSTAEAHGRIPEAMERDMGGNQCLWWKEQGSRYTYTVMYMS